MKHPSHSFQYEENFTSLQYYVPTAVAVVGINGNSQPIFVVNKRGALKRLQNIKLNHKNVLHHMDLDTKNITYLCLIALQPENRKMAISIFNEQFHKHK
jgi:hypothetical protein